MNPYGREIVPPPPVSTSARYNPAYLGSTGTVGNVGGYRPSSAAGYSSSSRGTPHYDDAFFRDREVYSAGAGGGLNNRRNQESLDYGSDYDGRGGGGGTSVGSSSSVRRRVEFEDDNQSVFSNRGQSLDRGPSYDRGHGEYSSTPKHSSFYQQQQYPTQQLQQQQYPLQQYSQPQYHHQQQPKAAPKPTLTPNYPIHGSRPPSAAGTGNEGPFSPRLRATSVETTAAAAEHSNLPKSLGSHSRYIQSLLEKTGRAGSGSGSVSNSPKGNGSPQVSNVVVTTVPSEKPGSVQQQQQPSTPVEKKDQQQQPIRETAVKQHDPAVTPTPATSTLSKDDQAVDNFATIKRSKPSLQNNSYSASATTNSQATIKNSGSSDSLAGEIYSIRNQVGLLERRFGAASSSLPVLTPQSSVQQQAEGVKGGVTAVAASSNGAVSSSATVSSHGLKGLGFVNVGKIKKLPNRQSHL
ncbi:UNVERIFIED_CONTAM: hypothetical protein HDU68_002338 [Siphonaria sp. JEL0065]|nr:hypothetical protein HDU68_002338 [Siphonaria sp. JEL0065]